MRVSALIRRAIVIATISGTAVLSVDAAAIAAPKEAATSTVAAPSGKAGAADEVTPNATWKMNHDQSQRLWNAAVGVGVVGVTALCVRFTGSPVLCAVVAVVIVQLAGNQLQPWECYEFFTKWTPPFYGARIVRC